MIGQREALRLFGCEVFDPVGQRIGIVGQLFLDEETEQPAWVTVQTGLFGTNESFVPLEGAAFDGDTLTVSVSRETVRQVPRVALHQGDLLPEHEYALYCYYGDAYGLVPDDSSADPPADYVAAVRSRLRRWVVTT